MARSYEPCLCGAPDCPRCFPSSWWHNPDTCSGDGDCDCEDPGEYEVDYDDLDYDDPNLADELAAEYQASIRNRS